MADGYPEEIQKGDLVESGAGAVVVLSPLDKPDPEDISYV